MFSLPRGTGPAVDVSLASATWEAPQAIELLAFRGGASLFVGAIPALENWQLLQDIYDTGGAVLSAAANTVMPPQERVDLVNRLEKLWRAAMLADCVPLGFEDDRHFVTIAGSRSGKGTSAIIPNLCLYPGSVVCLDPKGENASITAARRGPGAEGCEGMGQEVFVLDPFGVSRVPDEMRAGLNPLALLDPKSPNVIDDAAMLAEGLVVVSNERDSHWDESARNFLKGLILHLVTTADKPSLFTLRRLLTQGDRERWEAACMAHPDEDALAKFLKSNPSPSAYLLNRMRKNEAFAGLVAGAAETLLSCGENERGSILSTARRNTAFLDTLGPQFVSTLEGKGRTFAPDIFKKASNGASLYLCLPAERMGTHGRWLRIMIALLLEWAYRDLSPPASGAPILFLLEEFHSLGHMAVIEKAAGYAAGFGVKLWAVLQDIQQLKALYPNSWQTFLANAGAVQVFGISDHDTTRYVSKALGELEITRHVVNRTQNVQSGASAPSLHQKASGIFGAGDKLSMLRMALVALPDAGKNESRSASDSISEQIQVAPLLRPDEITIQFSRESGASLLLIKGKQPVWCLRVDYYDSPWFAGRYVASDAERNAAKDKIAFGERSPERLKAIAVQFAELGAPN
jgi:type IV secretion system protein VirD4